MAGAYVGLELKTCNCASCHLDGFVYLCHHVLHPLLHRSVIKATWKHEQQQSHWLQSCMAVYSSNLDLHHLSIAAWLHVCSQRIGNSINMWYPSPATLFPLEIAGAGASSASLQLRAPTALPSQNFRCLKASRGREEGRSTPLHVQHFPLNWNFLKRV